MRLKHILWTTAALVTVAVTGVYVWRAELAVAVASRVATQHLSQTGLESLPDGLHVGLCGAGSPFPDDRRSGPCTLVIAGPRMLVFDAGNSASRNIGKMGFQAGRIDTVFLTHFHSDHIDGLGELLLQRWVQGGHAKPLPVHGPAGVDEVVRGLMQTYRQDQGYRVAHHGETVVPASGFGGQAQPFDLSGAKTAVVLREGDLEVRAFAVQHEPVHPAVGYRISYKGRTVVISGDTVRSESLLREAAGADLLLHDALSPSLVQVLRQSAHQTGRANMEKVFSDILDYHATPEDAAETARQANVGYLLLHHIVPALPPLPGLEKAFLGQAASRFKGPIRVGQDGDFITLPASSKALEVSRRF